MTSKLTWAVVVLIVLGGAYYFLVGPGKSMAKDGMMQDDASSMTGGDAMNDDSHAMKADEKMTGTWKSSDDAKFTRTFNADGTFTDSYEGEPSANESGTYSVVDATKVDVGVPATAIAGMTVVKLSSSSGDLYFSINEVTDSTLVMTYLGRGNILSFTKVQ